MVEKPYTVQIIQLTPDQIKQRDGVVGLATRMMNLSQGETDKEGWFLEIAEAVRDRPYAMYAVAEQIARSPMAKHHRFARDAMRANFRKGADEFDEYLDIALNRKARSAASAVPAATPINEASRPELAITVDRGENPLRVIISGEGNNANLVILSLWKHPDRSESKDYKKYTGYQDHGQDYHENYRSGKLAEFFAQQRIPDEQDNQFVQLDNLLNMSYDKAGLRDVDIDFTNQIRYEWGTESAKEGFKWPILRRGDFAARIIAGKLYIMAVEKWDVSVDKEFTYNFIKQDLLLVRDGRPYLLGDSIPMKATPEVPKYVGAVVNLKKGDQIVIYDGLSKEEALDIAKGRLTNSSVVMLTVNRDYQHNEKDSLEAALSVAPAGSEIKGRSQVSAAEVTFASLLAQIDTPETPRPASFSNDLNRLAYTADISRIRLLTALKLPEHARNTLLSIALDQGAQAPGEWQGYIKGLNNGERIRIRSFREDRLKSCANRLQQIKPVSQDFSTEPIALTVERRNLIDAVRLITVEGIDSYTLGTIMASYPSDVINFVGKNLLDGHLRARYSSAIGATREGKMPTIQDRIRTNLSEIQPILSQGAPGREIDILTYLVKQRLVNDHRKELIYLMPQLDPDELGKIIAGIKDNATREEAVNIYKEVALSDELFITLVKVISDERDLRRSTPAAEPTPKAPVSPQPEKAADLDRKYSAVVLNPMPNFATALGAQRNLQRTEGVRGAKAISFERGRLVLLIDADSSLDISEVLGSLTLDPKIKREVIDPTKLSDADREELKGDIPELFSN